LNRNAFVYCNLASL